MINCAAYHVVDACEGDPDPPWAVNVTAVRDLALACAEADARLVHLSTNYVFAGDRPDPYGEDDLPEPRSVYGTSKLAGEFMARAYAPGALVIRTAGLYGRAGNASKGGNFAQRIANAAREKGELGVVADQRLTPTFTEDLAAATLEALEQGATDVVHLTNSGECTWHEFTEAILSNAGIEATVNPTATEAKPGLADRPLNGVLARPRADSIGLTPLRPWREALDAYMESW